MGQSDLMGTLRFRCEGRESPVEFFSFDSLLVYKNVV